jgi:hypothetical protein
VGLAYHQRTPRRGSLIVGGGLSPSTGTVSGPSGRFPDLILPSLGLRVSRPATTSCQLSESACTEPEVSTPPSQRTRSRGTNLPRPHSTLWNYRTGTAVVSPRDVRAERRGASCAALWTVPRSRRREPVTYSSSHVGGRDSAHKDRRWVCPDYVRSPLERRPNEGRLRGARVSIGAGTSWRRPSES